MTEDEIRSVDARASRFMEEGIDLMRAGDAGQALPLFERALELRRGLPVNLPVHAYGLAACWLNRAEALSQLGPAYDALTLPAYNEALALLRRLPLRDDVRFSMRLAIACQNRALILAAQGKPAAVDAIASLTEAIAVLDQVEGMVASERDFLLAVAWMNLANVQVFHATGASELAAQQAARRALALVKGQERNDARAAEIGLKARHVLCHLVARRLSLSEQREKLMSDVHEATDLADDGLELIREWEQRGNAWFRAFANDFVRFGARTYARYQPRFLLEFTQEQLHASDCPNSYNASREMQDAARDIAPLLAKYAAGG